MPDLESELREAIKYFWRMRSQQSTRQSDRADPDRGSRAAVTGASK